MFKVGDTFTPKAEYAKNLDLNLWDVYTVCKVEGHMVYWNGPGLKDIGGYGDGCQHSIVLKFLTPTSISLENK